MVLLVSARLTHEHRKVLSMICVRTSVGRLSSVDLGIVASSVSRMVVRIQTSLIKSDMMKDDHQKVFLLDDRRSANETQFRVVKVTMFDQLI